MRSRGVLLLGPALLAGGCARGCGHDRPYTPYRVEPTASAPAPAPSASVALPALDGAAPGGPFAHVAATRPPRPEATFALSGVSFAGDPGERVALALVSDLDGDGDADGAAWIARDGAPGRLVWIERRPEGLAPPRELVAAPAVPSLAACASEPSLEQIGPRTLAASLVATCAAPPAAGTPTRWLAIAQPGAEPAARLALRAAEPPGGEALAIESDAADRDGDGRDDLTLRVSIEGGAAPPDPAPRTTAELRWFDRPAGLSRDPEEPEASLRAIAASLLAKAARKGEAASVPAGVRGLRALATALCPDGARPVVDGIGASCGPSRALEDATAAEVRALLTTGDVLGAHGAWARRGWLAAAATASRRAEVEKWLAKAASAKAVTVRKLAAAVKGDAPGTAWGPLAFEPAGTLLVRVDEANVVRVDPATGDEKPASDPGWPLAVQSSEGDVTVGLATAENCATEHVCLGLAVRGAPRLLPLPLLDPAPSRVGQDIDVLPIAAGAGGLELVVAGQPVRVAPGADRAERLDFAGSVAPVHPGSPRSPDGRSAAFAAGRDVLVRTPAGWQTWELPDGAVPVDQRDGTRPDGLAHCTVANDAAAVACVVRSRGAGPHLPGWVHVLVPSR